MASTSGRQDAGYMDDVTSEEIALFRRSLLARRFPGLQKMSEGDLITLIRAERKATGRKLVADAKTRPKTEFTPPPAKRDYASERTAPFVPANPFQAKEQSARAGTERFINVNTPYDAHRMDFNTARTTDEDKRVAPFVPSCASQARNSIRVNYYLNSPQNSVPLSGMQQQQTQQTQQVQQTQGMSRGGSMRSQRSAGASERADL